MTPDVQAMLNKHGLENHQLSVRQAEDWVIFYAAHGPVKSLNMWETTLRYRKELLKLAEENVSNSATAA